MASIVATDHHAFDEDIDLIAMQMEELELFTKNDKGKYCADDPPDLNLALQVYLEDLQTYKRYLDDHKLAQSIGIAVHQDEAMIAALTSEDLTAHEDRQMALRLNEDDANIQDPSQTSGIHQSLLDEWLSCATETITANSIVADSEDEDDQAGPSMTFAERQDDLMVKLSEGFTCSVCHERHRHAAILKLQCNHRYCITCAKELFVRATRDETLFPPRCCKKPIDPELVRGHLSSKERGDYDMASVEFATVNRTYCSNRQCGRFLPQALMDAASRVAVCSSCATSTCCICNNEAHEGLDCPDDPALRETRRVALENGWQTCPGCNGLVQLRSGCNHMTCRCKTEFCYVCGARWKNCPCDQADEGRMIERAEEVVDRDAEAELPRAERNRRVRVVHAGLQDNHECEHPGRFQRMFGGGRRGFQCEMCDVRHWKYILQCRHCYINVCEDCRRNRI
ncbi:hypothetical protein DOTSEDRAFT_176057 [Dothistroma septosporum NZE10]|uniref:RBR-type E3 ubiquitin transferase n=1 Tax=Dothistroma septosporum (strain NZE10 / CBS 128990) TaxID=675120 RepID=N1PK48_DOTSN|nr:hypothetical protein DOTSEDRAFT_176057 [Dothistroma septosporum NZE10]